MHTAFATLHSMQVCMTRKKLPLRKIGESDNPHFCGAGIDDIQEDNMAFLQAFPFHCNFIYTHFRNQLKSLQRPELKISNVLSGA